MPQRYARRAVPALSVAALSLLAIGGSAHAAGTCPDPFVAATVNIGGTTGPGCRAIFTPYDKDGTIAGVRYIELPRVAGTVTAHLLAVGAGQSGQLMYAWGGTFDGQGFPDPTSVQFGGAGGAGGDVKEQTSTLDSCWKYAANAPTGGEAIPEQPEALPGGAFGLPNAGGGAYLWKDRADEPLIQAGSATTGGASPPYTPFGAYVLGSNTAGGGGGGGPSVVANGGDAGAFVAGPPPTGTGGAGAAGVDMSAQFPGLAGASHLGAGGGAAGVSVGGTGGAGGGYADGATINWTDHTAVPATPAVPGGGGGGGFQYREGNGGSPGSRLFYGAPSNGGDGLLVVDIPELTGSTSCSGSGGGSANGDRGSSSGGGAGATSLKATKPKVAAAGTAINTSVTSPGAGTAVLTGRLAGAPKRLVCTATRPFTGTGTARMTCVPGAGVQRLRRTKAVRVKLAVAFRPAAGGATQTLSVGTVTLPRVAARPIAVTG